MPDAGTPEWAAEAGPLWKLLPPAPGADGVVNLSVSVAPRREATVHWRYEEGRVVDGGPGAGDPPALALTMAAPDAREVFSGQVEPSVAFMRGRLKASGSGSVLLAFLRSTTAEGFEEWRSRVADVAG